MDKKQIYGQLNREYEKKRAAARRERDARIGEIYEMVPRVREIDEAVARAGLEQARRALEDSPGAKARAGKYRETCEALLKEKNAILKEMGIPRKYLEIHFECKSCGDTGYVDGKECACFRQRRLSLAHGSYKMKERLEKETFDNFDFRYYSSKKTGDKPLSPKRNMEKTVKYSLEFVKNFDKRKINLLFYGRPGLGKTFLCNSIARELIDKGYGVVYVTAFSLFKLLNDSAFGREEGDFLNDVMESDLLIIDDVGTEFSTSLTGTGFFNVINGRSLSARPVIISTNLDPEGLKSLYSERIYSRIVGDYTMFEFYGEDIRTLKKFGRFLE